MIPPNPYDSPNVLKSILTTSGADSGSSPETYNRANHQIPTSWYGAQPVVIHQTGTVTRTATCFYL